MQIIPAIDIIDGKCVRLTRGDYNAKTIYHTDPVVVARNFEENGLSRLHLVDLDGARKGKVVNWAVLENVCRKTSLEVDFSGGISSTDILSKVFETGASLATIGSVAVKDEALCVEWLRKFSPQKFIIGADVKHGLVMTRGWEEGSAMTVFDLIKKYTAYGVTGFMCTDVNKDGMLEGPAVELYKSILSKYPWIRLIASGGVSGYNDLVELKNCGVFGTIIGKAIYENKITLKELEEFS
jgi:phosphoribosylformimino-5-aminoimidazole carboxamide ribotide isomerase